MHCFIDKSLVEFAETVSIYNKNCYIYGKESAAVITIYFIRRYDVKIMSYLNYQHLLFTLKYTDNHSDNIDSIRVHHKGPVHKT